jgi:uncharacterized protein (TIGR02118 family)
VEPWEAVAATLDVARLAGKAQLRELGCIPLKGGSVSMIKTVAFLKRKASVSREEFAKHYEEVHAPLAVKCFPTIKKYVRNHVVMSLSGEEPEFDCITEFWFDSLEDAQAIVEALETEAGKAIRADEQTFMDTSKTVAYLVEERVFDQA